MSEERPQLSMSMFASKADYEEALKGHEAPVNQSTGSDVDQALNQTAGEPQCPACHVSLTDPQDLACMKYHIDQLEHCTTCGRLFPPKVQPLPTEIGYT